MFDSLRRWTGALEALTEEPPLEVTIQAMGDGGVDIGLTALRQRVEEGFVALRIVGRGSGSPRRLTVATTRCTRPV